MSDATYVVDYSEDRFGYVVYRVYGLVMECVSAPFNNEASANEVRREIELAVEKAREGFCDQ